MDEIPRILWREWMESKALSCGKVLAVIFRNLHESPRVLAEHYLDRDRTLVYKWLHDKARPSKSLIPKIVAFVASKAREPLRLQIRHELDLLVSASGLGPEVVAGLARTEGFEAYLEDLLLLAVSQGPGADPEAPIAAAGPRRARTIPIRELSLGALAILGSGILWNGINRLLGWAFYMGGTGKEPRGLTAALWGLTISLPILVIALLAARGDPPPVSAPAQAQARPWKPLHTVLYTLAAILGAWAFYTSGLRASVEGLGLGYRLQESLLALGFALLVPLLPLALLRGVRGPAWARPSQALGLWAIPALLVLASVFLTFFIDRPAPEVEQLRGFLAGLFLRTGMYAAARWNARPGPW